MSSSFDLMNEKILMIKRRKARVILMEIQEAKTNGTELPKVTKKHESVEIKPVTYSFL